MSGELRKKISRERWFVLTRVAGIVFFLAGAYFFQMKAPEIVGPMGLSEETVQILAFSMGITWTFGAACSLLSLLYQNPNEVYNEFA